MLSVVPSPSETGYWCCYPHMRLKLQKLQSRRNWNSGNTGEYFSGWPPGGRGRSTTPRVQSYLFITEFSKLLGKTEQGHPIFRILNPNYTADRKKGIGDFAVTSNKSVLRKKQELREFCCWVTGFATWKLAGFCSRCYRVTEICLSWR